MKYMIFILFALLIGSCSGTKGTKEYDISSGNMSIVYRGSACYGQCPVFNMKISSNGEIVYNGISNTKLVGSNTTTISQKQLKELVSMLETGNFFNLNDKYDIDVTDLPYTSIELKINDKTKSVTFRISPPKEIKAFVKSLDSLIDNVSIWTKKEI